MNLKVKTLEWTPMRDRVEISQCPHGNGCKLCTFKPRPEIKEVDLEKRCQHGHRPWECGSCG